MFRKSAFSAYKREVSAGGKSYEVAKPVSGASAGTGGETTPVINEDPALLKLRINSWYEGFVKSLAVTQTPPPALLFNFDSTKAGAETKLFTPKVNPKKRKR